MSDLLVVGGGNPTRGRNVHASGSEDPGQRPLDIDGVAERLGVSVRHVRRLVFDRRIPFIKWGAHLHFDPAEIDGWIDRHRQPERAS